MVGSTEFEGGSPEAVITNTIRELTDDAEREWRDELGDGVFRLLPEGTKSQNEAIWQKVVETHLEDSSAKGIYERSAALLETSEWIPLPKKVDYLVGALTIRADHYRVQSQTGAISEQVALKRMATDLRARIDTLNGAAQAIQPTQVGSPAG